MPTYVAGDTEAMIATCHLGVRRMHELLERYGKDTIMIAVEEWLDYCERMMRAQIEKVPDGSWEAEAWLDDDGRNRDKPLKVKVKITIEGSDITVDLTGSEDNVQTGFNVPFKGSTVPGFYTIMRQIFLDEATFADEFIPQNDGIFRPIKVIAPEGSIFNPTFPRSCLPRACLVSTAGDAAMKALSEVVPDKISALSQHADRLCLRRLRPGQGRLLGPLRGDRGQLRRPLGQGRNRRHRYLDGELPQPPDRRGGHASSDPQRALRTA